MQELHLQVALARFFATHPYYPCCLLIHHDVAYLQSMAHSLTDQYRWSFLSIGMILSESLLQVVPAQRSVEVLGIIKDAVQQRSPGPVLCTDIDLLFSPTLRIDALQLLREVSRIAPLIVLWPGSSQNGAVSYAIPDHAHYTVWPAPGLCNECIVYL